MTRRPSRLDPAYTVQLLAVFAAYFGLGWLGIQIASLPNSSLTLIWLPSGVALGAMLILGPRIWPAIWLGSFASNTPFLSSEAGTAELLGIYATGAGAATINTLVQGYFAYWLYRRLIGERALERKASVLRFTFAVILPPTLVNISLLMLLYGYAGKLPVTLADGPAALAETFLSFSLGDLHGYYLIAPFMLAWFSGASRAVAIPSGIAVALAQLLVFAALTTAALTIAGNLIYLLVPLGVFAALTFGLRGVSLFNLAMSLTLTAATARGLGPFADLPPWEAFVTLLLFIFAMAFTGLFLAAQEAEIRKSHETLEETVRERTADLRQALAAKDQFLAAVSHELRTPLHAIIGLTRLIQARDISPGVSEKTTLIAKAGTFLLTQLGELVDFVRYAGNPPPVAPEAFDLHALIEELREMVLPAAQESGATVTAVIDPRVPRIVRGVPDRLGQVLLNLASNAIKHGEGADVRLIAECAADGTDEPGSSSAVIVFSVEDDGPGVPVAALEQIFDEFVRLPATRRKTAGSGLGLAICRRLVTSLDGEIWASLPDSGGLRVSFALNLPPAAPEEVVRAARPVMPADHRARILLVEDDPLSRQVSGELLRTLEHEVFEAENADAALGVLNAQAVDVLIADIDLPGRSGLELMRQIRTSDDPATAGLAAAALTGGLFPQHQTACLDAGFNAVFAKPLDLAAVASFLGDLPPAAGRPETRSDLDQSFILGEIGVMGVETFNGIIQTYERALPALLAEMEQAIAASDWQVCAQKLHRLAGMSSNLGMRDLQHRCAELEARVLQTRDIPPEISLGDLVAMNAVSLDKVKQLVATTGS